jgi:hypothetical protein
MAKDKSSGEYGAEGGRKRAERLSKDQLTEIGRKGALARWAKEGKEVNEPIPAVYGSPDSPLRLNGVEIPCYVLADGRRVITQRGLQQALGLSTGGGSRGARRIPALIANLRRKGLDVKDLAARSDNDIRFLPPKKGGNPALAYEADILEGLCTALIDADKGGKLASNQKGLGERARILHRGFAKVGVIALVDEATGYQKDRPNHALAEILDAFIAKELRPWVRRFPFEFYQEIFRLKQWDTSDLTPNSPKPIEVGKITVDLIYRRLAPGVRNGLTKLTPRSEKGYLTTKLHRWLSSDVGDPKMEALIGKVVTVMKLSDDWPDFMRKMEKAGIQRVSDNLELQFPEPRRLFPGATTAADLAS